MKIPAVPLPVFDDTEPLGSALDSPIVIASGALVSKEGDRYWVHSLKELMAVRGRGNETLREFRARGHELKRVHLGEQKDVQLVKPKPGGAHNALRDVFGDIGVKGLAHGGSVESALVFSRADGAFVVVGTTYHCSKDDTEVFDQSEYDDNNGKCPVHAGGKLVRD
jgi:hypothetical protein